MLVYHTGPEFITRTGSWLKRDNEEDHSDTNTGKTVLASQSISKINTENQDPPKEELDWPTDTDVLTWEAETQLTKSDWTSYIACCIQTYHGKYPQLDPLTWQN